MPVIPQFTVNIDNQQDPPDANIAELLGSEVAIILTISEDFKISSYNNPNRATGKKLTNKTNQVYHLSAILDGAAITLLAYEETDAKGNKSNEVGYWKNTSTGRIMVS